MGSSAPRSAGAQRQLPGKTSLVLRSYFSFVLDCEFEFEMSVSLLLTQQKDKPRPLLAVPPATACFLYFVFGFVCVSLSQHKWKVSVVRVHLWPPHPPLGSIPQTPAAPGRRSIPMDQARLCQHTVVNICINLL